MIKHSIIASYRLEDNRVIWESAPIYGSSRVGVFEPNKLLMISTTPVSDTLPVEECKDLRGNRKYEISNHLGNVLAVITDKRTTICRYGTTKAFYEADLVSASDFYAFGSLKNGRNFSAGSAYRFGFNGKEIDKGEEGIGGGGSTHDYGFRIYNPNIGKFLSVDPLNKDYPWYTPFQFAGNMPIIAIDLDGLEPLYMINEKGRLTKPMISLLNSSFEYNTKRMLKSRWKEVSFDFGAITLYKTIKYDHSYIEHTDDEWARTIAHEHKHRNEIGNFIGRAIGWYLGYGVDYLFAGLNYNKINAEERAYGMEPRMDALMAFEDNLAMKVLKSSFSETQKATTLKYVGLCYKLDVEENKLSSLKTKSNTSRKLEKKIEKQQTKVNNLKVQVSDAKTKEVEKIIATVKE